MGLSHVPKDGNTVNTERPEWMYLSRANMCFALEIVQ